MPLQTLCFAQTRVWDVAVLKDMPLKVVTLPYGVNVAKVIEGLKDKPLA